MSLGPHIGSASPGPTPGASPYRFGKYTLLAKLAQGGMGEVFAALLTGEAGFEKLVVIKRILPHLAEDPRFVSMFLTEARVTASLTHPNICQVFELGQIDGEYFLAMEYLEGVSLARLIRQNANRGLDLRVAASVLCQALEGLQFAHCFRQPGRGMVGIIHRDMSPSNVFVTSAGLVKVLDFGVAKVSHHSITTATGLKGKYPYMSPEQIRGLEVDGRADLFAVGVLLYETVTGRSLFHRQNDFETLFAVVEGPRPAASDSRADIPLGLEEVIDRSLRVAREERFASAREMSEAITRAMEPLGGVATGRELAEIVRRDCANDLEEERDRIHNATSFLTAMTREGQEPPEFINRRPRPVVALPPATTLLMDPDPRGISSPSLGETSAASQERSFATDAEVAAMRRARSGARNLVAVLLILAALGAGAAGWWLRGSAQEAPIASLGPPISGDSPAENGAGENVPAVPTADTSAGDRVPSADPPATATSGLGAAPPAEVTVTSLDDPDAPADEARKIRPRRTTPRRADKPAASRDPGFFSVDALPYAEIYIDGDRMGITPLVRVSLKPGKHTVRAVTESGVEQSFTITIKSGETVSRRLSLELLKP